MLKTFDHYRLTPPQNTGVLPAILDGCGRARGSMRHAGPVQRPTCPVYVQKKVEALVVETPVICVEPVEKPRRSCRCWMWSWATSAVGHVVIFLGLLGWSMLVWAQPPREFGECSSGAVQLLLVPALPPPEKTEPMVVVSPPDPTPTHTPLSPPPPAPLHEVMRLQEPPVPELQPTEEPIRCEIDSRPMIRRLVESVHESQHRPKPVPKRPTIKPPQPPVTREAKVTPPNRRPVRMKFSVASKAQPAPGKVVAATLIHNPNPQYSEEIIRRHLTGTVVLQITISPTGHVSQQSIAESSGEPLLDQLALDTIARWRFSPARRGSRAIPWSRPYTIRFY